MVRVDDIAVATASTVKEIVRRVLPPTMHTHTQRCTLWPPQGRHPYSAVVFDLR